MQNFRRTLVALSCLIVGAASFALSFVALRDVSIELMAVDPSLAFLVPVVIDGGIIGGSAVIWSYSQEQAKRPIFPFLFVASLVIISVIVNASHAGPSPLAKIIAALPPLVLLGVLELVAAQHRRVHDLNKDSQVSKHNTLTVSSGELAKESDNSPVRSVHTKVNSENKNTTTALPTNSQEHAELISNLENQEVADNNDMFVDIDSELESLASYANSDKKSSTRKPLRVRAQEPGV